MVFLVSLGLLNLLLTTIITDHKTAKSEVTLNNLIFKAQYAILVDYTIRKVCSWAPLSLDIDIGTDDVLYCTRYFCPNVLKEQNELPALEIRGPHVSFSDT